MERMCAGVHSHMRRFLEGYSVVAILWWSRSIASILLCKSILFIWRQKKFIYKKKMTNGFIVQGSNNNHRSHCTTTRHHWITNCVVSSSSLFTSSSSFLVTYVQSEKGKEYVAQRTCQKKMNLQKKALCENLWLTHLTVNAAQHRSHCVQHSFISFKSCSMITCENEQ